MSLISEIGSIFNHLVQLPQETLERNQYNKIIETLEVSFKRKLFDIGNKSNSSKLNHSNLDELDEIFNSLKNDSLAEYDYITRKMESYTDQREIRRRMLGRALEKERDDFKSLCYDHNSSTSSWTNSIIINENENENDNRSKSNEHSANNNSIENDLNDAQDIDFNENVLAVNQQLQLQLQTLSSDHNPDIDSNGNGDDEDYITL